MRQQTRRRPGEDIEQEMERRTGRDVQQKIAFAPETGFWLRTLPVGVNLAWRASPYFRRGRAAMSTRGPGRSFGE
jgi:hypothetical protein